MTSASVCCDREQSPLWLGPRVVSSSRLEPRSKPFSPRWLVRSERCVEKRGGCRLRGSRTRSPNEALTNMEPRAGSAGGDVVTRTSGASVPYRSSTDPPRRNGHPRGTQEAPNKTDRCASLKSSKDKSASARAPFSSRTASSADRAGSLVWQEVDAGQGRASPSAAVQLSRSWQPRPSAWHRRIEDISPNLQRRCVPTNQAQR